MTQGRPASELGGLVPVIDDVKAWILLSIVLLAQSPREGSLRVGDAAVDFNLVTLDGKQTFKLSSNYGKRPSVLIFGSYT